MSFQTAVSFTSPDMSIASPAFFNSVPSPTFHPANSLPSSDLNVGVGSSYLLPLLTVLGSIVPLAPASVWNVTLNSMSFQIAFTVVLAFIWIFSPAFLVSLPTCQPANFLPSGGANLHSGNSKTADKTAL